MVFLISCSSTRPKYPIDSFFKNKQYESAQNVLETNEEDYLIKILNKSIILQAQGKFKESNSLLFEVKNIIKWNDFLTIKDSTLSFVLNEKYKKHQLAEYEQFLVQVYVVLNFLYLNDHDSALVELRNLDNAIYNLKQNNSNFSFLDKTHISYLSGMVYEMAGKYDEAFIDYMRVAQVNPNHPYLKFDLYRTASYSHQYSKARDIAIKHEIPNEYKKYIDNNPNRYGHAIFLYHQGMSPLKDEHSNFSNVPVFIKRMSHSDRMEVYLNNSHYGHTFTFLDIEKLAVDFQEAQVKSIHKKEMARKVLKEMAAWAVALPSGFVSVAATRTAFQHTGEADLRSWYLLPQTIQIARIGVKQGTYNVKIKYTELDTEEKTVSIKRYKVLPFNYHL